MNLKSEDIVLPSTKEIEDSISITLKQPPSQRLELAEDLPEGSVWRVAGKEYDKDRQKTYIVIIRVDGINEYRDYVGATVQDNT